MTEQKATIDHLIINSPFEEPKEYWHYDRETRLFEKRQGRRPAGYVLATESSKSFDDPGEFIEIKLVNRIRPRIKEWRENNYPGVTGITKRLLEFWNNSEEREFQRYFFCQLEAIETLIWLTEAPESQKLGIEIPGDGGEFKRICSKMATGSGKTIVMALVIAWQILNKVASPQDKRFSKNILVMAPGLTVRNRIQVLIPDLENNYYDSFRIVPSDLKEQMRQGKVIIKNWHALNWDSDEIIAKKKSIDKRGALSDEAYCRMVLEDMAKAKDLLVINDEAHHAWRYRPEIKIKKGISRSEIDEATKWVNGLDRIHSARGILTCYDFTATPFAPTGKKSDEEGLFGWIVSDFGLNDAIEAGLVKTPRVVIRDNSARTQEYKSRLYHIYNDPEVKDDLSRSAEPNEPLPDLVLNAYYLLGQDWEKTFEDWKDRGAKTPPVMISVVNRTETSARIKNAFESKKIQIQALCDTDTLLQIDSKVLEMTEKENSVFVPAQMDSENGDSDIENSDSEELPEKKISKKDQAMILRRTVDTVGQVGQLGEKIRNVISVGMLTEGWDAKTVTHIMGLRAFSSQLLCEQVVGRGLRRTSYDIGESGLFQAEYVNIFGVPFTFLPHEGGGDQPPPPPPPPKTRIEPVKEKLEFEISFPNIIRIQSSYKPVLELDLDRVPVMQINANDTTLSAEMAPILEGKIDISKVTEIDLEEWGKKNRMQRVFFTVAQNALEQIKPNWEGNTNFLLAQLIKISEAFILSDKIQILPEVYNADDIKRRIILTLNMSKIVRYMIEQINYSSVEYFTPIFDSYKPIKSTEDMLYWFSARPCEYTRKSHINFCTFDSTWEASEAYELDHNPNVLKWVKNDHLGFEIFYLFKGIPRKYRPDFIIQLKNGETLVLEVKGQKKDQDDVKRRALGDWINAVNTDGRFGIWKNAVSYDRSDLADLLS